jgi:uncharacterized membrane protein YhdT
MNIILADSVAFGLFMVCFIVPFLIFIVIPVVIISIIYKCKGDNIDTGF